MSDKDINAPGAGPGTNTGHGHVWPRPDGVKARCGGPGMCAACSVDKAKFIDPTPKVTPAPKPGKDYDTTLARIAGNIAPAVLASPWGQRHLETYFRTGVRSIADEATATIAGSAVDLAEAIVAEVKRRGRAS